MSLSKINETPLYFTNIPSSGEKTKYRPFLVKEERALLTAAESEDANTMYATLESIVRNCLVSPPKALTTFDLEYLFVQIRSKSVGEYSDVNITCDSCGAESLQSIDLRKVSVKGLDQNRKIKLSDSIVATMKYPSLGEVLDIQNARTKEEAKLMLIRNCIDSIYHGDDVYVIAEESDEEVVGFLDTLNSQQYALLKKFIDEIPTAEIEHEWECAACKAKHKTTLKGLFSFFWSA